jgi:hypothetical protein
VATGCSGPIADVPASQLSGSGGGLFWDRLVESTRRRIWAEDYRQLPIVPALLGLRAGLIGAALIAPD